MKLKHRFNKTTLVSTFLATLISGSAFAAPETYTLDSTHTFPRFSYNHFGFSKQLSRFNEDFTCELIPFMGGL